MDYLRFSHNVFSQNGEDGIIQEILPMVSGDNPDKWCVEFGAWDGKHMSNTFNLVSQFDWNAVYIEGNADFYKLLESTVLEYPRITPIHRMISPAQGSSDCLDKVLANTPLLRDFLLLSIDIDSYDLAIWQSLSNYSPRIVIIEINSGIYPGIYEWHNSGGCGNSFSSTLKVSEEKGYSLVCHTGNMIFVRNDFIDKFNLEPIQLLYPETLFNYRWLPNLKKNNLFAQIKGKIRSVIN
jgi:hypothetical protein